MTQGFYYKPQNQMASTEMPLQNKDRDDFAGFEEGDIANEEFLDVDDALTTRRDNLDAMFLLIIEDIELKK